MNGYSTVQLEKKLEKDLAHVELEKKRESPMAAALAADLGRVASEAASKSIVTVSELNGTCHEVNR